MGLITPDYGLLFWMLLSFSILMLILKKFAWKPILNEMKNRKIQFQNHYTMLKLPGMKYPL